MISRRDFLKGVAFTGLSAAAAVAFWSQAPKNVEAYKEYLTNHITRGTPIPRKPPKEEAADVYHAPVVPLQGWGTMWPDLVKNTFYAAGLNEIAEPGDTVIIKQHLGERGRESYLRPHLVRAVIAEYQKMGANPILCDTLTTPYYGMASTRSTMLNYFYTARIHGYTQENVGCPVIPWSDGSKGDDHIIVPIDGNQLNEVYIARLLLEGDAFLAFTHSKGHPMGVIGGSIKNLGIGGMSAHGKLWEHSLRGWPSGKEFAPREIEVDPAKCTGLANCPAVKTPFLDGDCTRVCPFKAFEVDDSGMVKWDPSICADMRCTDWQGYCTCLPWFGCTAGFIERNPWGGLGNSKGYFANTQIRYADCAWALASWYPEDKIGFLNIAKDIMPWCDCVQGDGLPLVPDQGVLGSKDLAAVDAAFLDLCTAAPPTPGSLADLAGLGPGDEKFGPVNGGPDKCPPWYQVDAVVRLGGYTKSYNLLSVEPKWNFPWADVPFFAWDHSVMYRSYRRGSEKRRDDPRAWYV